MALSLQQLRSTATGVEPLSLLPGQICFNVVDKVIYVGDGTSFKTSFDGTTVPGVAGNGWYSMPMDFSLLNNYYVANPEFYGDVPTDQQVLSWSDALNHPIWTTETGTGGSQVYITTNAAVAVAPGATVSDKITTAIGVVSPDEGDVAIVTGLPDDVYEGLYFFTTSWVKGAAYAYPSASEVIYNNTGTTLGATVQLAINDLNTGLIATTATANTAFSTANSALSIASAALPKAGGTMTGAIIAQNIDVQTGYGVQFNAGAAGTINGINDSVNTTSSTVAASSTAIKTAYDIAAAALPRAGGTMSGAISAQGVNFQSGFGVNFIGPYLGDIQGVTDAVNVVSSVVSASATAVKTAYDIGAAALPRSGGTMTGVITFEATQVFPVSGIQDATTGQKGIVQIGTNINVLSGTISVNDSTTSQKGVVQLDDTLNSSSLTLALTARAGKDLQDQIDSLTLASNVTLAGSLNANTGLIDSVTTLGSAAGFVAGAALPAAAAGNADYYVLVTTGGSYNPPGGGGPYAAENGDWFLSTGTAWQYLGVGARPQSASYTTAGIVQLADTLVTYTGTSDTEAVTPNSLQDKLSDSTSLSDGKRIASSVAVKSAYDAAVAAQTTANNALPKAGGTMTGNITFQDAGEGVFFSGGSSIIAISDATGNTNSDIAASSTAVKIAYNLAGLAIPCSVVVAKGSIIAGSAASTPTALAVGTNGQVLAANSACATGLEWVTDVQGDVTGVSGTSPITVDNTNPQTPVVGINAATTASSGAVQLNDTTTSTSTSEAATANAVKSAYDIGAAAVPKACYTALGALAAGTGASTVGTLALGTNGQFLSVNSSCSTGVQWCTISLACIPCSAFTASGQLLAGTGTSTFTALNVGSNNQILVADSACTGGLKWLASQGAFLCGYSCSATPFNTAVGGFAGDSITTGTCNTVFGYNAGTALTGGLNNTFIGFSAGDGYTSADNSTAVGSNALGNTGGNNNTAVGFCAGGGISSGGNNTMIGTCAGRNATTADNTTVLGFNALSGTHTGNGTVALGACALAVSTNGGCNTAVGCNAGLTVTTGALNTLVGFSAGSAITTGSQNTLVGRYTGTTTLANNVVLSDGAGTIRFQANSSGAWSYDGTNFGTVGQVLASNGTATAPTWCTLSLACVPCSAFTAAGQLLAGTGSSTFTALTVGTNGQFLSANSACSAGLEWCTVSLACVPCSAFTGSGQLLTGTGTSTFTALPTGTNGQVLAVDTACTGGLKWLTAQGALLCGYTCSATPFNTVLGSLAGAALTSNAVANTAIGYAALDSETAGDFNTAVGHNALTAQNGSTNNTAVGANAGAQVTTGGSNTLVGYNAGDVITTGGSNTAFGSNALGAVTTVSNLVAVGSSALQNNTTGTQNTAVGFSTLSTSTSASNNTALGYRAGVAISGGSNNTLVGTNAGASIGAGSCNTLVGNSSGSAITTGACNTLVGGYTGTATLANNVVLSDGAGNIKLQVNENGAVGVGTTPGYGTAGQVLKSAGTGAAPAWSSALYGAFSDSTTQTNTGGASGNPVDLNTTASSNGFSIVSGTQITATTAGVYNIQISLQFEKTDAGTDAVEVWFKKNGTNIANSNTNIELKGGGAKQLFALNLVEPLTAGQYLEVWWYSADVNAQLTAVAAGTRPAIPSAIVTVVPVGA